MSSKIVVQVNERYHEQHALHKSKILGLERSLMTKKQYPDIMLSNEI